MVVLFFGFVFVRSWVGDVFVVFGYDLYFWVVGEVNGVLVGSSGFFGGRGRSEFFKGGDGGKGDRWLSLVLVRGDGGSVVVGCVVGVVDGGVDGGGGDGRGEGGGGGDGVEFDGFFGLVSIFEEVYWDVCFFVFDGCRVWKESVDYCIEFRGFDLG